MVLFFYNIPQYIDKTKLFYYNNFGEILRGSYSGIKRESAAKNRPFDSGLTPTLYPFKVSLFLLEGVKPLSVFIQQGISRTAIREENDYYATDPRAMEELLKHETFNNNVWECACGEGNLSKVLESNGYNVFSTDLIDRGFQDMQLDFLQLEEGHQFEGDIITNPPFKHTTEFILKALAAIPTGNKVAMFLKINYLSGKARYKEIYSKFPPQRVYVFPGKFACSKNNTPEGFKGGGMDWAWFIWEKGKYAPTELKWIEI